MEIKEEWVKYAVMDVVIQNDAGYKGTIDKEMNYNGQQDKKTFRADCRIFNSDG